MTGPSAFVHAAAQAITWMFVALSIIAFLGGFGYGVFLLAAGRGGYAGAVWLLAAVPAVSFAIPSLLAAWLASTMKRGHVEV